MRRAVAVLVGLGMTWLVRHAAACEPWDRTVDLPSAARRAGLVVAARRADATLVLAGDRPGEAFATFDVETVLKGQPPNRRIVVAARWLRDEGVEVLPRRSVLLFLERRGDRYFPVSDDCAVRTLPVSDGRVWLADVAVPLDIVAKELGLAGAEAAPSPQPRGAPPAVIFAIACAGAGFVLGHRMARGPRRRERGLRAPPP